MNITSTYIKWNVAIDLLTNLEKDAKEYGHYKFAMFFALGIYTGLRFSDLIRITWDNVLGQDYIEISETKTKKYRKIKINPELRKIIMRLYPKCDVHRDGERILLNNRRCGKPFVHNTLNLNIKKTIEKYDIDNGKSRNYSTHSLRKTFGRRVWEQHGESEKALILLNEIFNHMSIKDTIRYLGIRQQEIEAAYDCLSDRESENPIAYIP